MTPLRRLGVCCSVGDAGLVRSLGADFAEPSVAGGVVVSGSGDGWALSAAARDAAPFPSFAVLFPGDLSLLGVEADGVVIRRYVTDAFAALGEVAQPGAVVVFGSGRSRRAREGLDRRTAERELAGVVRLLVDEGNRRGLRVVLEPLNTDETNFVTSIAEAVQFLDAHDLTQVGVVCDLYHVMRMDEPLTHLTEFGSRVGHVHLADTGRRPPGQGDWPVRAAVQRLLEAGYPGDFTIECRWDDLARELPDALAFVRHALA